MKRILTIVIFGCLLSSPSSLSAENNEDPPTAEECVDQWIDYFDSMGGKNIFSYTAALGSALYDWLGDCAPCNECSSYMTEAYAGDCPIPLPSPGKTFQLAMVSGVGDAILLEKHPIGFGIGRPLNAFSRILSLRSYFKTNESRLNASNEAAKPWKP